jgi:hypothetical protein
MLCDMSPAVFIIYIHIPALARYGSDRNTRKAASSRSNCSLVGENNPNLVNSHRGTFMSVDLGSCISA